MLRYATEAARIGRALRRPHASRRRSCDWHSIEVRWRRSARQAELLEWLADEYYLVDQLDLAIAASDRAMELRARAGDVAGVSTNHHALSVYHWYNADRDVAERHATDAIAVFDGDDAAADDVPRGHGLRCRRSWPCTPATSTMPRG